MHAWILFLMLPQASPGIGETPRLLTEDGHVLPLTRDARLPVFAAGQFLVPFAFQATDQDPGTGLWLEPELHAVYSLRDPATDPATASRRWVYGDGVDAPEAVLRAFDPATGKGQAVAVLPTGIITRSRTWGHVQPGQNELVVYWGTRAQVHNDGLLPPPAPMGSWRVVFTGEQAEVLVSFLSCRTLELKRPAQVLVLIRDPRREEVVFQVRPETRPEAFVCPAEVRVPAGQAFVSFQVVPRIVGQDRLVLTSPAFPGKEFRTQLGVISLPLKAYPAGGQVGTPREPLEPSPVPWNKCRHAKASTPDGTGNSRTYDPKDPEVQDHCGPWSLSPSKEDCSPPPGQPPGKTFAEEGECEHSLLSSCYKGGKTQFQLRVWKFTGRSWIEQHPWLTFGVGIGFKAGPFQVGGTVVNWSPLKRACCEYEATSLTEYVDVPDCRP